MLNDAVTHTNIDVLHLVGAPTLSGFVDFVRNQTVAGGELPERTIIERWCAGSERFRALAQALGDAESSHSEVLELAPSLREALDAVINDRDFQHAFGSLPIAFGMVALDDLIVCQHHVALDHVERLKVHLTGADERRIFNTCLPINHAPAPLSVTRTGSGRYIVQSPSDDVRYLGTRELPEGVLEQLSCEGHLLSALGLMIGVGSNFINVVHHKNRMILNNGYHRAYALRALGISRIPCVIQAISHPDELGFAGGSELLDDYDLMFTSKRPPLFKDFFDPSVSEVFLTPASVKQIHIKINIETVTVRSP